MFLVVLFQSQNHCFLDVNIEKFFVQTKKKTDSTE